MLFFRRRRRWAVMANPRGETIKRLYNIKIVIVIIIFNDNLSTSVFNPRSDR